VVQEAAPAGPPRAAVVELALAPGGGAYGVVARCELDFELDDAGKGIEGLAFVSSPTLGPVLIALCEGNSCLGGGSGRDPGAGRALVARLVAADATINSPCRWEVLKTIDVPASADFQDYSGLAPSQALGAMAVLSQEDAALWVGGFDFDGEFSRDLDRPVEAENVVETNQLLIPKCSGRVPRRRRGLSPPARRGLPPCLLQRRGHRLARRRADRGRHRPRKGEAAGVVRGPRPVGGGARAAAGMGAVR
jgi:hypothetical protein